MAVDSTLPLKAHLISFGSDYTLTRVVSPGIEDVEFTGIIDEAAEPEEYAPGVGSINNIMTAKASDFDPMPVVGDEIVTATAIYTIVRSPQIDSGGGITFALRHSRDIP